MEAIITLGTLLSLQFIAQYINTIHESNESVYSFILKLSNTIRKCTKRSNLLS